VDAAARPSRIPAALAGKTRSRVSSGMISGPTFLETTQIVSDRQVGDYVFLKTLGKGTFGKVKLAEHIVTKKLVGSRGRHIDRSFS
jgi:serine/threonine protein kinase